MGIKAIHEELCTGCGICIDDCPMDVLRMDEAKGKAYIKYAGDCMACLLCDMGCPEDAIEVSPECVRKLRFAYKT